MLCRAATLRTVACRAAKPAPALRLAMRQLPAALSVRSFGAETFLDKGMVAERVLQVIKNFEKVEPSKVTEKATFKDDLGLDSLDAVEVVMAIEEEFAIEIPDAEADAITSVEEAINFISTSPMAK